MKKIAIFTGMICLTLFTSAQEEVLNKKIFLRSDDSDDLLVRNIEIYLQDSLDYDKLEFDSLIIKTGWSLKDTIQRGTKKFLWFWTVKIEPADVEVQLKLDLNVKKTPRLIVLVKNYSDGKLQKQIVSRGKKYAKEIKVNLTKYLNTSAS
jgi:hypothetical protein